MIPMARVAKNVAKRKRSRPKGVGWLLAAAAAVLLVLTNEMIGASGYLSRRRQQHQIQDLTSQIDQLQNENQALTQRIDRLRGNPAAIEEMAREQLHLGRPGEVVVALPPQAPARTPSK